MILSPIRCIPIGGDGCVHRPSARTLTHSPHPPQGGAPAPAEDEELTAAELRDRQEFAFEAALQMRDRFMRQEVWERMGVDVKDMVKFTLAMPDELRIFQKMLFSKIVPNCKKLGLLDAGDGWLRDRFTDIGVIEFENWVDTVDEYDDLDEVAKDRALAEG